MLSKRIIPCLDIKDGRVVKGVNFVNLRDAGDPAENAAVYQREGADELAFLDIAATLEKRKTVTELVRKISRVVSMPFTVGGGVQNNDDIRQILSAGADKVSINTAAVRRPQLISEATARFGSQCVVVAVDAKLEKNNGQDKPVWRVCVNGGNTMTDIDVISWVKKVASLGAGEILLTSMDRDGTKKGFDIPLTRAVANAVDLPVIASGGAGSTDHFIEVFSQTRAAAALAASIFHFREVTIGQIKDEMGQKGIAVRR